MNQAAKACPTCGDDEVESSRSFSHEGLWWCGKCGTVILRGHTLVPDISQHATEKMNEAMAVAFNLVRKEAEAVAEGVRSIRERAEGVVEALKARKGK